MRWAQITKTQTLKFDYKYKVCTYLVNLKDIYKIQTIYKNALKNN